jgi:pyruvate-formate lyase-activating enzyme
MKKETEEQTPIYSYLDLKEYTKEKLQGILDDVTLARFLKIIDNCKKKGCPLEETIEMIQESVKNI